MEVEQVFEVREVDLEYEFDASMYFDFTRDETQAEASEAELWFGSAMEYPPSPFVTKLVMREDVVLENVNTSPKSKGEENILESVDDVGVSRDFCAIDVNNNRECEGMDRNVQKVPNQPFQLTGGLTFYNHMTSDKLKAKAKSTGKPRSSTLMKPTACQLAKQNQPLQFGGSRFQTVLVQNNERSLYNSSGVESQAAKRQKLEGGHLCKVPDTKQQANLVHKAPRKDGTVDKNSANAKLKLTIPREPDLETAHRAQRIRPKNTTEPEHVKLAARRFKARPLNRKILEAPSLSLPKKSTPKLPEFQEFHLKTLERAMQHTSTFSSSSLNCNDSDKVLDKPSTSIVAGNENKESRRPSMMDTPKQGRFDIMHNFKAHPLNKKIFSSKGDIGVFRNSKRETTVPMEFNFRTEKRVQHNPPIDLFSKLSLTTELQPNNGYRIKLPQPTTVFMKGSKENRLNSIHEEHETLHFMKGKPPIFGGKQVQYGSDACISEVGTQLSMRRNLGIR